MRYATLSISVVGFISWYKVQAVTIVANCTASKVVFMPVFMDRGLSTVMETDDLIIVFLALIFVLEVMFVTRLLQSFFLL
jgi:hypothetical protein